MYLEQVEVAVVMFAANSPTSQEKIHLYALTYKADMAEC